MNKTVTAMSLAVVLSALAAIPAMAQGLGTGLNNLEGEVGVQLGIAGGALAVGVIAIESGSDSDSSATTTTTTTN